MIRGGSFRIISPPYCTTVRCPADASWLSWPKLTSDHRRSLSLSSPSLSQISQWDRIRVVSLYYNGLAWKKGRPSRDITKSEGRDKQRLLAHSPRHSSPSTTVSLPSPFLLHSFSLTRSLARSQTSQIRALVRNNPRLVRAWKKESIQCYVNLVRVQTRVWVSWFLSVLFVAQIDYAHKVR